MTFPAELNLIGMRAQRKTNCLIGSKAEEILSVISVTTHSLCYHAWTIHAEAMKHEKKNIVQ